MGTSVLVTVVEVTLCLAELEEEMALPFEEEDDPIWLLVGLTLTTLALVSVAMPYSALPLLPNLALYVYSFIKVCIFLVFDTSHLSKHIWHHPFCKFFSEQ